MFEGDHNRFGLKFNVAGENINTNDLFFTSEDADVKITGEDSKSIKLQLAYGADQYIEYVYTIKGNGFNLGLDINTKGIQNKIDQKTIALDWETILLQKEQNIDSERQKSTIYYKEAGNVDHLSEAKDEEKELKEKVEWIAFKQHYFSNILSSKTGFSTADINVKTTIEADIVKLYSAAARLSHLSKQDFRHDSFAPGHRQSAGHCYLTRRL